MATALAKNTQHEPVVGARILLMDANGNQIKETTTASDGSYEFLNLRPGQYSIVEITPDELIDGAAQAGHHQWSPIR